MKDKITIKKTEILSDDYYTLKKVTYHYQKPDGSYETQVREVYDRGHGAAILLYNRHKASVILTRQFRLPTFINPYEDGMLIESCAGMLDDENPENCIRREAQEETGYQVEKVTKVFEAYTSPGVLTEKLHFFVAEYNKDMKVGEGGGLDEEQEHIEVIELKFNEALKMIYRGDIKDAKTILLLQYAKIHELVSV